MKTIRRMEYEGYEGVDADLTTSLQEYGIAWKRRGKDWHFIYGVGMTENENGEPEYNLFDWADIPVGTDPRDEWNFVNWKAVAECSGMTELKLLEMPLTYIVETLVSYYGYEDVFGSSYFPFPINT